MQTSLRLGTLLALGASVAQAQTVAGAAVAAFADHRLLATLTGGAIHVGVGPQARPTRVRLALEHLGGVQRRLGAPCAGTRLRRGVCPVEPLRDAGQLTSGAADLRLRVVARGALQLDALGTLRVGRVRVQTRGETSGGLLSAAKWLGGGDVGAVLSLSPHPRSPIAVELGAAVGALSRIVPENIVDGYTPFDESPIWRRLTLGVTWRARR